MRRRVAVPSSSGQGCCAEINMRCETRVPDRPAEAVKGVQEGRRHAARFRKEGRWQDG